MPVDLAARIAPLTVIDANQLLWAARIRVSVHVVSRMSECRASS